MTITREQFMNRVEEMAAKVPTDLVTEARRLLDSGYFDLENAPDNYIEPKVALTAALLTQAWNWSPPTKKDTHRAHIMAGWPR